MNIAYSNCHSSLAKSAIEILIFQGKAINTSLNSHISSSNENISCYDGHLHSMTTGIQG